jgi:hypothetical protein
MKSIMLLLLFTASLLAQWSNDPNVNTPVVMEINDQRNINAISDGEGGIIIAWMNDPSGNYNNDIYVQKLDNMGNAQWTTNGVPICTATSDQHEPGLIGDGSGGAIIAWYDVRNSAYSDIYAQKISAAGNTQWIVDGIEVCTAYETQKNLKIISDGAGGAIIVWQDYRNGSSNPDIFIQKVSSTGSVQWGTDGKPVCTAIDYQEDPVIVPDESGGAIITWDDDRGVDYDIYAQKVDATGNMLWANDGIMVCNAFDDQYYHQTVSDGVGGAIITWTDYRNDIDYTDIYAQRINSSGNPEWQENGVAVSTVIWDQSLPKLINDNSGGVIIVWEDLRSDVVLEYYAQRLNSQGDTLWATDGIPITNQPTDVDNHAIIHDGSDGAIITWQDGSIGNYNIYAQKISSLGILQWIADGITISSANISQEVPIIISNLAGGAIITWEDSRNAPLGNGDDIYAQQVSKNGNLGEIISDIELEDENPNNFNLFQNYPNPFNPATTINYHIAEKRFVILRIYDVLGNEVATLINKENPAGEHKINFNSTGLTSGVYFYRLHAGSFIQTRKMILMK